MVNQAPEVPGSLRGLAREWHRLRGRLPSLFKLTHYPRGWTLDWFWLLFGEDGFPAHAGMDPR